MRERKNPAIEANDDNMIMDKITKGPIIALDLDGTLLNSNKELTPRNYAALRAAAEMGAEIVPSTGRFYKGMPEVIRQMPFVKYVITINGAQVIDVRTGEVMYSKVIPTADAIEVFEFFDTLPVLYDCYVNGWGYMTESMKQRAHEFIGSEHILRMVLDLRDPVPELKSWLKEGGYCPHKLQAFTKDDTEYRNKLLKILKERYPQFAITTSHPNNIEINSLEADKGRALIGLADVLGIDRENTIAFGDGLNDITMLRAAGTGIAMDNGCDEAKEAADLITEDCDSDGVAAGIEKVLGISL